MRITEQQANEIDGDDSEEFVQVEQTDIRDDGKYQHYETIFKKDDKFYMLNVARSGSYFSEYYYQYDLDCPEVKKVKKVVEIEEWEPV